MRGLKIQHKWIRAILSGEKTMDVRSEHYQVLGQRVALGNSGNGLVEGYATIQEIIQIPFTEISRYDDKHHATKYLETHYAGQDFLFGFILTNVMKEKKPFPYKKSPGICFNT